jgi:hypothetical protein
LSLLAFAAFGWSCFWQSYKQRLAEVVAARV